MKHVRTLPLVALFCLLPAAVTAGTREDIEVLQAGQRDLLLRLERIESLVQNQGLLELMQQVQSLQTELQELRGEVEKHTNDLEGVQKRQRELYLDIDRRLNDLQLQGAAAPVAPSPGDSKNPAVAEAAPAASAAPAAPSGDQERTDYMNAFEILRESRYTEAIQSFTQFLVQYPHGKYANNAQYWLAEAYYASRDLEKALTEFDKVINQYPWSSKIPDAKLKLGYTHYELNQWAKARDVLTGVMTSYPNSSFALLAEKRLTRMTQEGH
ncbi:MAG TPA: tol-pal system protein YbgF [Gammaproteobacteria bacterium]